MRSFAARTDSIPVPADTHGMVVQAAVTPQAFDWPAGMNVVRFTGASTGSTLTTNAFAFCVNLVSTYAVWGTAFDASTASSGQNALVNAECPKTFRIPDVSTGFSVSAGQAGLIGIEYWKVGG